MRQVSLQYLKDIEVRTGQQKRQAEETANWQDEKWESYSSQDMTVSQREAVPETTDTYSVVHVGFSCKDHWRP